MRSYFIRVPKLADILFPRLTWRLNSSHVFLTFDDGPDPVYTPAILDLLRSYQIQCTFFLITEKCILYPELVQQINDDGHTIGFHGHTHQALNDMTLEEINSLLVLPEILKDVQLYRPPYGKISRRQIKLLSNRYSVVMYSFVLGDFDSTVDHTELMSRMKKIKAGDIVLLHENLKSLKLLQDFLSEFPKDKFNPLNRIN